MLLLNLGLLLITIGRSSCYICDIVAATQLNNDEKILTSIKCNKTMALYNFTFLPSAANFIIASTLEVKITCNSSQLENIHFFYATDFNGHDGQGSLFFSQLQPPLLTEELSIGSACQLQGCLLSVDKTKYHVVNGGVCTVQRTVNCTISWRAWGEWSNCYGEYCLRNRTREPVLYGTSCESNPSIEYQRCSSSCHSIDQVSQRVVAIVVILITLIISLLCLLALIWIGIKCFASRHYKGMLHGIKINQEKEIFDADSELVKVGSDSPTNIAMTCTSVESLDLIQPLWTYDNELDTDTEVSDSEWVMISEEACNGTQSDEDSKLSHTSGVTECFISLEDDYNYRWSNNENNFPCRCAIHREKNDVHDQHTCTPEQCSATIFRQTILTDVTIAGYVHTKLLKHSSTNY